MIKLYCLIISIFFTRTVLAQLDTLDFSFYKKTKFSSDFFSEAYYCYDLYKPKTNYRQKFFSNYNRHNDFNINLAIFRLKWDNPNFKIRIGFQGGTYTLDNYVRNPWYVKHINQAYSSFRLSNNNKWWMDLGVMYSYIGFEGVISFDNYTLTRSILAENSPYYVSGAKLKHSINDKLSLSLLLLNGWQEIIKPASTLSPSLGTQILYNTYNTTLNLSSYLGDEYIDSLYCTRIFNNAYMHFGKNKKSSLILNLDYGLQQNKFKKTLYNYWYGICVIVRQKLHKKLYSAFRLEVYNDEKNIIITNLYKPIDTKGISFNLDFCPSINIMIRTEFRFLTDDNNIFLDTGNKQISNNYFLTTSFSIRF